MKKDIIPEVENVFFAAVQEWDDFMEKVWYAYLVNDSDFLIESVVVSKLWNYWWRNEKTSLLRHALSKSQRFQWRKLKWSKSVLALNNEFMLTFFMDGKLYDKNSFSKPIPSMKQKSKRTYFICWRSYC
jgi:hypothetical protein